MPDVRRQNTPLLQGRSEATQNDPMVIQDHQNFLLVATPWDNYFFGYTVESQIHIRRFLAVISLRTFWKACWTLVLLVAGDATAVPPQTTRLSSRADSPVSALVNQYCADCHDREIKKGGLDFESILSENVTKDPEVWEKVVRKLRARQMPPMGKP